MGTLIMERLTRDRRYKLVNNRLIIETCNAEVASERVIGSAEEFGEVLDQTFHISPPAPAQEIFARLGR
jgi:N-hydroxyarylamine O-acetyltransferase